LAVSDRPTSGRSGAGAAVATTGIAALAIACCAGLPLLAGLAGSVAIGTIVGGAAGLVAAVLIVAALAIRVRSRRASCRVDRGTEGS
jgi:hypothetical protein